MQIHVEQVGATELARDLAKAPAAIRDQIAKDAYAVGQRAVRYIRSIFRSEGGPTSTWRRSGQLAASYDSKVDREATDVTLTVGAIKPTDAGQVPLQARIQEGFDFAGNKVSRFVITPKKPGGWLTFPIRQGGGLAVSNIIRWARVRRVVLIPRPALEPTSPAIIAALEDVAGQAAANAL